LQSFQVSEILMSFMYGLKLDISFSSYIAILPAAVLPILLVLNSSERIIKQFLLYYTSAWIILLSLIYTIDAELFSFWGFRLDSTIFRYSGTPGEAIGSAFSSPIIPLLGVLLVFSYGSIFAYKKLFYNYNFSSIKLGQVPVTLFSAALLVIPIRGGFQQIPINESVSYYSVHGFLNQAALNPAWTLGRSLIEQNKLNPDSYEFFNSDEAVKILRSNEKQDFDSLSLKSPLTNTRPNIVLIVWESLTSKVLNDSVTPHLYSLLDKGIYFSELYASGDRSDKGLVAILSAYPAQPTSSIMTEPEKSRKLPFITKQLKDVGYQTSYMYGGELEFANMSSYMSYNGYDEIIGKRKLPNLLMGAWGAPDEITFNNFFEKIQAASEQKEPFFHTLFTLSSHEPYDIPAAPVFKGTSKTDQFQNAHHYTDSCLYAFIEKAQQQAWWKNTWVIIIADHGHVLPGDDYATHDPSEFHIPMLWLGGAVKKPREVKQTYSQINLAPSIAKYLKLNPNEFRFSKPINLNDTILPKKAWYSFNDGFCAVYNQNEYFQYDLNSQKVNSKDGFINPKDLTWSKAFLQVLLEDYSRK